MTDQLSVFGFPARIEGYHSLWVARTFAFWGAISYFAGGLLAVPVLDQAVGSSAPPQAIAVASRSLIQTTSALGVLFEKVLMLFGVSLLLAGIFAWILSPELYDRTRQRTPGVARPPVALRLVAAVEPSRVLLVGAVVLLLPSMARVFADEEFAKYLWGQCVFTLLACVIVGIAYMAAELGRSTFATVSGFLYAYTCTTLIVVGGLFAVLNGPWTVNLLFGLALPGPGLLILGLHLCYHVGIEQRLQRSRDAQMAREHELAVVQAQTAREQQQAERQRKERETEQEVERARQESEAVRARELVTFLNSSR